jgi:polyhydroxyalkanoate synthesis repressor PhaR
LVVEKIDFVVVDKKNNADITRSILLQVIAEQEHLPDPILTQEFMVNVIRSYGGTVQGLVSGHLEQSLKSFLSQHQPARERGKSFAGGGTRPEDSFKALSPVRLRDNDKDREESNFTK